MNFNFNLGLKLISGNGLSLVLIQTSPRQLDISPGDWVGNLAAMHSKKKKGGPGTEIAPMLTAHTNTHTNSYTMLLEKLLCLSEEAIKSLWSLRFFLRSQWKMVRSSCRASDYSRSATVFSLSASAAQSM